MTKTEVMQDSTAIQNRGNLLIHWKTFPLVFEINRGSL